MSGATCGWSSTARCLFRAEPAPDVSATKYPRGNEAATCLTLTWQFPAPRGSAARDAGTLAIADEAAASGRRSGAAAVV